jgi:UDP:flavonoid glycosyltransferase YjiC (YdhE family)
MVPLARALVERGHEVRWATAPDACAWLAASGIDATACGRTFRDLAGEYARAHPDAVLLRGEERPEHLFRHLFGALAAPAMMRDLGEVVREWKPNVIINEAAELAAPIIGTSMGIPHVTHSFGLAIPRERLNAAAELTAALWAEEGLDVRPDGGMYDDLYIDIYPPSMQPDDLAHIERVVHRRPESGDLVDGDALPEVLADTLGLDDGTDVVYLTFGTTFNHVPSLRDALAGLSRLDVTVVVTVGPGADVQQFGALPGNVHVAAYVPQSLLLPHCSAIVSHGGSGTMLAGLSRGLPQLMLPQGADQFRNASAFVRAGAGLALAGDDVVSADAIERDARMLLADSAYRLAAGRLRTEIDSMPSADEVAVMLASRWG